MDRSESRVLQQFLQLAQGQLGQLLNQCKFSLGLMPIGDSALIIECKSIADVKALEQQVRSLASLAATMGTQWIFIRSNGRQFYAFNINLVHALESYEPSYSDLAKTSRLSLVTG